MPPPPSSNISRFAADIIVGSEEMPNATSASFSGSSGASGAAAAATASSAPAPFASAAIAFLNRASASDVCVPFCPPAGPFLSRPPNRADPPPALRACRSSFAAASRERSARTFASISPITSRMVSRRLALNVPPPSSPETYPPSEGRSSRYVAKSVLRAPSAMSSVGRGGRKSFPTSMESNTKSSTMRSQSYSKGKSAAIPRNSWSRYSRSSPTCSSKNPSSVGFCSVSRLG